MKPFVHFQAFVHGKDLLLNVGSLVVWPRPTHWADLWPSCSPSWGQAQGFPRVEQL